MSSRRSGKHRLSTLRIILAALTMGLCGLPLSAQITSGTITGRAQDSTGAMVKGATVTVSNPSQWIDPQADHH